MRSTPILLDRLRHIRYDLQSMWDMDHLIDGGLINILEKEVSFDTCQTLLWFGLLSEDPGITKETVTKLMESAGIDKTGESILKVFTVCITELFNSGVFETPAKQEQKDSAPASEGEEKPAPTMRGYILELVKLAYLSGINNPSVIWKMTPTEIEDLAYTVRDRASPRPQKPQSSEDMLAMILAANAAFGGVDLRGNI